MRNDYPLKPARRFAARAWRPALGAALLLAPTLTARAHSGEPPAPHDLASAWSWEPWTLLGLFLAAYIYFRGLRALWSQAGIGRGVTRRQAAAYFGALVVLFAAIVSPLDALSDALFSAHMVQHLLLMLVAAPLLVYGAQPAVFSWALPQRQRVPLARFWLRRRRLRRVLHWLTLPIVVWVVHTVAVWLWHMPRLYNAAVGSETIHLIEHASFLAAAVLFWWVLADFIRQARRGPNHLLAGVVFVFTIGLHNGLLGALITFANTPWYAIYAQTTQPWGLSPLEDQQLAGVIMWVPSGIIYLLTALGLLGLALQVSERQDERRGRLQEPTMTGASE